MAEYADPVIDWLDQSRTLFARRYFRQVCIFFLLLVIFPKSSDANEKKAGPFFFLSQNHFRLGREG